MATERGSILKTSRQSNDKCRNSSEALKVINIFILPTTGGEIQLQMSPLSKVSTLKSVIETKLKLAKEKIILLQRNSQLVEGTLKDNDVTDGARIILVPCVEAGLLALRPEHSVLKALNTLTDTQVDNVLTGRVPLNLTMRLGGHVMFIQLQLTSAVPPSPPRVQGPAQPTPSLPTPPSTPTPITSSGSSGSSFFPTNVSAETLIPASNLSPPSSPETLGKEPVWSNSVSSNHLAPLAEQTIPIKTTTSNSIHKLVFPPGSGHVKSTPSNAARSNSCSMVGSSPELAEASRHLTHTLKQLSSVALGGVLGGNRPTEKCEVRHCQQNGAVIESLYHHGKGIYSGTFVGTLSPSLQDTDGRPRQNIGTIVHILNDLLGASLNCHNSSCCPCPNPAQNRMAQSAANTSQKATPTQTSSTNEVSSDAMDSENEVIRGKIEHIQSMMKERRQRRKARREVRSAPYPNQKGYEQPLADV